MSVSLGNSRNSVLPGPAFIPLLDNCQLLGGQLTQWDSETSICTCEFVSGSETAGESKDLGTSFKVVIVCIVHIKCTYIYA